MELVKAEVRILDYVLYKLKRYLPVSCSHKLKYIVLEDCFEVRVQFLKLLVSFIFNLWSVAHTFYQVGITKL